MRFCDWFKTGMEVALGYGWCDEPPVGRRLTIAGCLFCLGLFLSFWYREKSDNGGLGLRPANVFGLLLVGIGLFVWWGTFAFPSTWGWWL